ncbi:hypothetical protein CC86DRAFT_395635 [Ophiobolus disseminans]|uniref:Ubiquitin 3 binding protein But2 C-terminal domain-containing protein n=1 Tax=Ophiobolus disseminans TaxID=1469910 RepID=A0A6A6ZTP5_9PLEO|nr:hypothetical protein CC86DRAFT_395635 [Ophiobolus disseminans]
MLPLTLCSFLLAIATIAFATLTPQDYGAPAHLQDHPQHYFLRGRCPKQPWDGRHIVALPTSHQLGFENYTVAPTTPPLNFRPIQVANGNYALCGEGDNDDHDRAPILVSLKSTTGTRTASMAVIYISKPARRHHFKANADACPEGYECVADQWMFDSAGDDLVHSNFRFAGYTGTWEPFKDAGAEGWHVYWKGNAGVYTPIDLDLVPTEET